MNISVLEQHTKDSDSYEVVNLRMTSDEFYSDFSEALEETKKANEWRVAISPCF